MPKLLGEIYADLSFGPFQNLALGMDGIGQIHASSQARIGNLVNRGLTELHGRFLLVQKELKIRTSPGRTLYSFEKQHADEDPDQTAAKYIADTPLNPYHGDLIRVLMVFDNDKGELPLNDLNSDDSLFTPSEDILQVPNPVDGEHIHVMYQARHAVLDPTDLEQKVYLPEALYEALQAWIAYRHFSGLNGPEHSEKGAEHLAHYEMICNGVTDRDLAKSSLVLSNHKLEGRGFR